MVRENLGAAGANHTVQATQLLYTCNRTWFSAHALIDGVSVTNL